MFVRTKSKSQQIREAWTAGDCIGALRIAAHFQDRSCDTIIFKRGFDAHDHGDFYRQLGKDPERLTAAALALLEAKFKLNDPAGPSARECAAQL
jgi:hypothetical protein